MSMIGHFQRISDDEIRAVLADPESVASLTEWWNRTDHPHLDIDKAWHGLHYLLTGSAEAGAEPLNFILTGGEDVGDVDVGYGPARVFTSVEVHEISTAISNISPDELRRRFDPEAMTIQGVYPNIWQRDPADDDSLGYLIDWWDPLKHFVTQAAQDRSGLLVWLS